MATRQSIGKVYYLKIKTDYQILCDSYRISEKQTASFLSSWRIMSGIRFGSLSFTHLTRFAAISHGSMGADKIKTMIKK